MILQIYDKSSEKNVTVCTVYVHLLAGEKGANVHLYTFDEGANVRPLRLARGQMS